MYPQTSGKIRRFTELAAHLGADIAIFPECCTTGYFIGDKLSTLAEPDDGATAKELGDIARSSKLHLAVGMFTKDGNAVRNSQLLFAPTESAWRPTTRPTCSPANASSGPGDQAGGCRNEPRQDRHDHLL